MPAPDTLARRLGRVPARLRPRRFRLYCVGLPRTGTTSMARIFQRYRALHLADAEHFVPLATRRMIGDATERVVRWELKRRSWRFGLEVDSAAFLSPFVESLAHLYPDAKFALTVRDCFSWLDSQVEALVTGPRSPASPWYAYREARLARPPMEFDAADRPLEELGLFPVAAFFRNWAETYERVLAAAPADRLMVIRTENLDDSLDRLASFCGVDAPTLTPSRARVTVKRTNALAAIPESYVVARAQETCGRVMERYWGPGWTELSARRPRR